MQPPHVIQQSVACSHSPDREGIFRLGTRDSTAAASDLGRGSLDRYKRPVRERVQRPRDSSRLQLRIRFMCVVTRIVLLAALLAPPTAADGAVRPNFILIFTDDQGYGVLLPKA